MHIFTDGSCVGSKEDRKAGWSVVVYTKDKEYKETISGKADIQTNQRAELLALKTALEISEDQSLIYTDSIYGIKCIREWSKQWKENDWKTTKKEDVKHRDIIEPMVDLYETKNITLKHVKGHQKGNSFEVVGNNLADVEARKICNKNEQ